MEKILCKILRQDKKKQSTQIMHIKLNQPSLFTSIIHSLKKSFIEYLLVLKLSLEISVSFTEQQLEEIGRYIKQCQNINQIRIVIRTVRLPKVNKFFEQISQIPNIQELSIETCVRNGQSSYTSYFKSLELIKQMKSLKSLSLQLETRNTFNIKTDAKCLIVVAETLSYNLLNLQKVVIDLGKLDTYTRYQFNQLDPLIDTLKMIFSRNKYIKQMDIKYTSDDPLRMFKNRIISASQQIYKNLAEEDMMISKKLIQQDLSVYGRYMEMGFINKEAFLNWIIFTSSEKYKKFTAEQVMKSKKYISLQLHDSSQIDQQLSALQGGLQIHQSIEQLQLDISQMLSEQQFQYLCRCIVQCKYLHSLYLKIKRDSILHFEKFLQEISSSKIINILLYQIEVDFNIFSVAQPLHSLNHLLARERIEQEITQIVQIATLICRQLKISSIIIDFSKQLNRYYYFCSKQLSLITGSIRRVFLKNKWVVDIKMSFSKKNDHYTSSTQFIIQTYTIVHQNN